MYIIRFIIIFLIIQYSSSEKLFPKEKSNTNDNAQIKNISIPINGWSEYKLGADINEIIDLLKNDSSLTPKTDPESDISEEVNEYFISLMPTRFFDNFYFQFINKKCYLIRIIYSKKYFSYLKLYNKLKGKYGIPSILSSKKAVWINNEKSISLERPTVIKYIDNKLYNETEKVESKIEKTDESLIETFLNNL